MGLVLLEPLDVSVALPSIPQNAKLTSFKAPPKSHAGSYVAVCPHCLRSYIMFAGGRPRKHGRRPTVSKRVLGLRDIGESHQCGKNLMICSRIPMRVDYQIKGKTGHTRNLLLFTAHPLQRTFQSLFPKWFVSSQIVPGPCVCNDSLSWIPFIDEEYVDVTVSSDWALGGTIPDKVLKWRSM